jgi:large subunit ribosomal protein L32
MALPKRKVSKTRRDKRRTHDKAMSFGLVNCESCGEMKRAHYMCPNCRTYSKRQILPEHVEA